MYGHKIGHTYCNVPVIIYWCDVELINLVWTYDYVRIDLINIKLNMRSATKFLSTVGPTIMQFCHDMFFFNTWWTITGVDINWYMQGCDRRGFLYIEWVTFSVQSAQHQGSTKLDLGGFDFYDAKLCIMANSTWAVCPWSLKPLLSIHPAYNPFLYICQNWSVLTIIPNADYHHSILIIRNLHLLLLLPLLFPMVSPNNNMITLNQCIVNIRPNTDQRYFNS